MKYFKCKKVVTEHTTLSLVAKEDEKSFLYTEEGEFQYFGVDTTDVDFLENQHVECEVEELTFAEIQPVLNESNLMKSLNEVISKKIKTKYSLDDEIALIKKDDADASKIAYNEFVDAIKLEVNAKKVEAGLKE